MKRSAFASYFTAALLALGAAPALAQENPPANSPASQGASRPNSGSTSGSAVSRPSGGGGSSAGSSAGTASSAGSSSSGVSSSTPSRGGGRPSFGPARPSAPERRSGDYAVPRGLRDDSSFSAPGARTRSSSAGPRDASGEQRRAVPAYSRPRGGNQPVGEAIDRRDAPARGDGGSSIIFYPYYDPYYGYSSRYSSYGYGPWLGGYGFGLGYFYDPWGTYGYYSPYNYDYGYGGSSYGSGRYSGYDRGYRPVGNLRLKVKPAHGQVYVDGYFAGEVDNFDGVFQRLSLEAGPHQVEIRAEGHETVTFEVMVTPGETVTYKGELKRIQ